MRLLKEIRNYMGNYHVKSGVYHYYRQEHTQAIAFLRKALAEEPGLTDGDRKNARCYLTLAHKGLAERLASQGETEGGVEQLGLAAQINPTYPDIHFLMAQYLERLGRNAEAIAAYRKALECQAEYLEARIALGYCLLSAGQAAEAVQVFEQAVAEKVARIERPFRRGVEQLRGSRASSALESFHQVFRAVPALAAAHLRRAVDHERSKEPEKALEALERAIELNPTYPDVYNFRGIVLCEQERYDEAVRSFRRSAQLAPGHKVPRLNLAFTFLRAGRHEEAEAELQSILAEEPSEPVALAKIEELESARQTDKRLAGVRTTGA